MRHSRRETPGCVRFDTTGKSLRLIEILSSPRAKKISLPFFGNMCLYPRIPLRQEGRLAIVTTAKRVAMDALVLLDDQ